MKTGDVILFQGKTLASRIIQLGTWSKYSHVGIVFGRYLLHSTSLGDGFNGVRLDLLEPFLEGYEGKAYLMEIEKGLSTMKMSKYYQEIKGTKYEEDLIELIGSQLHIIKNKPDTETLFCSELVAEALKRTSKLELNKSSNEYTPKDISKLDGFKKIKKIRR